MTSSPKPTPHLAPNWKAIVKRAWSIRLIALAALVDGLSIAWPLFEDYMPIDRLWFAVIALMLNIGAFYARLKFQRNLRGGGKDEQA